MYVDDNICPMQDVVNEDGSLMLRTPKNATCRLLNPFPQRDQWTDRGETKLLNKPFVRSFTALK